MTVTGIQRIVETTDHEIDVADTLAPNGAIEIKQHGTQGGCKLGKDDINAMPLQTMFMPVPGGEQIAIFSHSDEDKLTGKGIGEVQMHYISATDGLAHVETIVLNGTASVFSVATDVAFINQLHSTKAGSMADPNDTGAMGDIWAVSSKYATNSRLYQVIQAGKNWDDNASYMVPMDKILLIESIFASVSKKAALVVLRSNTFEGFPGPIGMWIDLWEGGVLMNSVAGGNGHLDIPVVIIPGAIVKATTYSTEEGADVSINWGGILIPANSVTIVT